MNFRQLLGRAPSLPLDLQLSGEPLRLLRWLRVLPGQRYVGEAQWRGRRVLAKLLVGGKAARHFRRELEGARLLAGQGLATPTLLAEGQVPGEGAWLLFDYLEPAQSLWQAWHQQAQEAPLSTGQRQVLGEALGLIGQLHRQGLWQADLHLDNLLRHDGRLFVIDGGGVRVETPGQPLSRERALENLGVFFAQLPATLEPFIEELLVDYLLVNGEHGLPLEALLGEIDKVRRWRLRDYLRKAGRDCSLFAARAGAFGLRVVRREEEASLAPLLATVDSQLEAGHIYKTGGAASVARLDWQGRALVLKRYNIKDWRHALKRFWRPSRAWHSWLEGHRLEQLGIATPRPLAVLERRWCWLRGRAYLLTEHCAGEDLLARFAAHVDGTPPEAELRALESLLATLIRERISHGDLKGHNLFWDAGQWSLIDLDAMRQHRGQASFAKAYARDRARLLRNWPERSALYRLLDQRLPRL